MKNKKGQALVEFILILPILILIILAFIDISRLTIVKTHLESLLASVDIDDLTIEDKEYDIEVTSSKEGENTIIELKSCLDVATPGLGKILGEPSCVKASKIIKEKEEEGLYEKNAENN